jgi:hypothetical protein
MENAEWGKSPKTTRDRGPTELAPRALSRASRTVDCLCATAAGSAEDPINHMAERIGRSHLHFPNFVFVS